MTYSRHMSIEPCFTLLHDCCSVVAPAGSGLWVVYLCVGLGGLFVGIGAEPSQGTPAISSAGTDHVDLSLKPDWFGWLGWQCVRCLFISTRGRTLLLFYYLVITIRRIRISNFEIKFDIRLSCCLLLVPPLHCATPYSGLLRVSLFDNLAPMAPKRKAGSQGSGGSQKVRH